MFQTVSVQFRFAERADAAVERGLSALSVQSMPRSLVAGLTPGWRERPEEMFRGDERALSGLTQNPLHAPGSGLSAFSLELAEQDGETVLRYASGDTRWELARLDGRGFAFSYRGADLIWRRQWPPRGALDFPPFDDGAAAPPPPLPRAIKLAQNAGAADEQVAWLIALDWRHEATPRLDRSTE